MLQSSFITADAQSTSCNFLLIGQKVNAAAGFGGNAESLQPAIGGAQTKLRLDSMEKFFCSQGLASPIEQPGAHAFTSLHSKSDLHLCFVP